MFVLGYKLLVVMKNDTIEHYNFKAMTHESFNFRGEGLVSHSAAIIFLR